MIGMWCGEVESGLQENEKSWDIWIINFNDVFDLNKIM